MNENSQANYVSARLWDRDAAIRWARDLISRPSEWVILDTETTGLGDDDAIVQIGVLSPTGHVLLDALVAPEVAIPPEATAIHGLQDFHVADALLFPAIYMALERLLFPRPGRSKQVVIYNAEFDVTKLMQACQRHHLPDFLSFERSQKRFMCAMRKYAAYVGEWSNFHHDYRYQVLPGGTHCAIDDCRRVLDLIAAMAATPTHVELAGGVGNLPPGPVTTQAVVDASDASTTKDSKDSEDFPF